MIRQTKIMIWTITDGEDYFPQLEVKAHIFTLKPFPEKELNDMIKRVKEVYDFNDAFSYPVTRRRIAYETETVSPSEVPEDKKFVILTVYDDEGDIRTGFPKRYKFTDGVLLP